MALVSTGIAVGLNYGTHLLASYAHNYFCMPQSIIDVFRSFVTTASPVCSVLINTMQVTQTNFASIVSTTVAATIATALMKT